MLAHVVDRARAIAGVDEVVVATSVEAEDDAVEVLCAERGWRSFRGSREDVLDRYYRAAEAVGAAHVIRVTADCPLLDHEEAGRVVSTHLATNADYTHNITVWGSGMPLGTGTEIFTADALARSWREGHEPHHREHVDEYVGDHPELFHVERVDAPDSIRAPELRLTVDTPADLELLRAIYAELYHPPALVEPVAVVELLRRRPDLAALNAHVVQKPI